MCSTAPPETKHRVARSFVAAQRTLELTGLGVPTWGEAARTMAQETDAKFTGPARHQLQAYAREHSITDPGEAVEGWRGSWCARVATAKVDVHLETY